MLWITYLILDIILLVFVAFIFMSALSPLVLRLQAWKFPKALAILVVFVLTFLVLGGILAVGFTPLITQTSSLSLKLTDSINSLLRSSHIDQSVINNELSSITRQAVSFTLSAFSNLINFVSVIVVTFYLLLDRERIEKRVASLFVGSEERVGTIIHVTEDKLGAWVRGQLVLSIVVGTAVYLGLLALGVEYALPLAILAGLMEVVPVIGPIISAIPGILIALTVSPFLAVLVTGLYLAVQQLESHIIVPQVMKRAVGLNPLLVIISVAVGTRLLGVGGALLAVPIAVVIQVLVKYLLKVEE